MPSTSPSEPLRYPITRMGDRVDDYHGTHVSDPYRWLEDDLSQETADWVTAQNAVTFGWLDRIPYRAKLRARLTELVNYPRQSAPEQRGPWLLFARNDGLQNQPVWMLQRGEEGIAEVLLDPNSMSEDGTTRVAALTFNAAATHIAYMVSHAGSDWQQIRAIDLLTRTTLPDTIDWVKVSAIAWHGDGFFYSRYPAPADGEGAYSSKNEDHQVWYHRLGTAQAYDTLVYHDSEHAQRFHVLGTTEDERYAVLSVSDRGQGKDGNALLVKDLRDPHGAFAPVWTDFDDQFTVLDNDGDALLVLTNRGAPNQRVVRIDPAHPAESSWQTIIPEQPEPLETVGMAGGRLFACYLRDVTSRVVAYQPNGTLLGDVAIPGLGTVMGFNAPHDATVAYYSFTSFTEPATVYRYDIVLGTSAVHHAVTLPFDPSQFETTQVFIPSKDGTRIPAFIVAKRGLVRDGTNPTLIYGYGGFNVSLPPAFSALRIGFLEQGGVYVQANLRGGGEYGEAWHQAGMKERKQNVFDDAIAVAEWLIAERYTSSDKLAIQGGSNGGLLVGAIMTQRPDLVKVALPAVGVLDMLRFHTFTIGWNWIADYGSSENPDEFRTLFAYSPLHNLRDGTTYPATLITTADHDDRVVPAHSFKFAARLQAAHQGTNPVLIRIETKSGHGASSLSKQIEETTDVFAFLFENLGVTPRFSN